MENDKVPKSFGCFPHRSLRLSLTRSRSAKSSANNSTASSPRNTPKSPFTPRKSPVMSKEDEYREVFQRFDNDSDGKISAAELRAYFGSVREYMSYEEAQSIIRHLDSDGDDLIDFKDFLRLVLRKEDGGRNSDVDHDEDLKAAFETFEIQKGCGRITPESLQSVLSRLGSSRTYEECVAMIEVYDSEGKGELHFHDFRQMMTASA